MINQRPPRDNLVRAVFPGPEFRDSDDPTDGRIGTLSGHFAVFNSWAKIDSAIEGRFMERISPTAFTKTFAESAPKVLFQHGKDPQVGDKPLGAIDKLESDDHGARYEVGLLDTSYNRDLLPGLKAGLYGASFRFSVVKEKWDENPVRSNDNPDQLPERTILEARVPEFGPVTFPAYANATASARSMTDEFVFDRLTSDPERLAALIETKEPALAAEPAPATPAPSRAVPAVTTSTPETTRSLEVEYITRDEKVARIEDLKRSLTDLAVAHPGVLPAEAQIRWDTETKEQDELERDVAAWDARQARVLANADAARAGTETSRTSPVYSPPTIHRTSRDIYDISEIRASSRSDDEYRTSLRDNAMRSVDGASFPNPNLDEAKAKEGIQHLLDHKDTRNADLAQRMLVTGSPQYKREFNESLRTMRATPYIERAAALAVTGTTTTGGYMLPYTFDPTFIKTGAWTNINPYRQICRVESIVGSNNWQGVSVGAVPAIYETEALAVTEAGPTFARPTLTAQRASSFVSLSYETLQDRPDIGAELSVLIQEGKDTLEEAQFSIGVGTTVYPLGMFVKSTFTVKETITNDTFAVADLDATEAALPIRHRRDAVWMLSRAVIRIIQGWETAYGKLFNSTLGYPAVGDIANNPGGNTGMSLLGYPVFETPSAPVTVTTDDTIVGILVSPKNYMILDRVGMNVELIPNLFNGDGAATGQRGVLALWRNTAKALNADAGRQININ